MSPGRTAQTLAMALVASVGGAGVLHAGVITTVVSTTGPGLQPGSATVALGSPVTPNNDNASPSTNLITIGLAFAAPAPVDIVFAVQDSGGTTEYFKQIGQVAIFNNTGVAWAGYRLELGFGVGDDFVPAGLLSSLDFDTPQRDPPPTASAFTALVQQEDRLDWSGGVLPSPGALSLTYSLDVPDGLAAFQPQGLNQFTLRQVPVVQQVVVPEPHPLPLLGLGAVALLHYARLRRRAVAGRPANEARPSPRGPSRRRGPSSRRPAWVRGWERRSGAVGVGAAGSRCREPSGTRPGSARRAYPAPPQPRQRPMA